MIDKIVDLLFRWGKLRDALLTEAHIYNILSETLDDPKSMETAALFWNDGDGWRSWEYDEDKKRYFFNDIPEDNIRMAGKNDSQ